MMKGNLQIIQLRCVPLSMHRNGGDPVPLIAVMTMDESASKGVMTAARPLWVCEGEAQP